MRVNQVSSSIRCGTLWQSRITRKSYGPQVPDRTMCRHLSADSAFADFGTIGPREPKSIQGAFSQPDRPKIRCIYFFSIWLTCSERKPFRGGTVSEKGWKFR